ncbi:3-oxoacyl-[acyl-carrier-protein] reductase FabG-like [Plodia interpunctella]|uniref:3-oxoacyl-[acyl-carrier-protein] reductase FabG-like n=1 Tax=Plodia interpunctella TaxID=58824 RepID=UPI00236788E2|nr:3-oxoacyl-[acyl-carrier-protein] reductase FabG-like [Plodia interpunctella]
MTFINKVVLVTGAGSGIGEAIAKHFAKLSARLSLVDVNSGNLKKTAEACEKLSRSKVFTTVTDLTNDEDIRSLIAKTAKEYGRIDIVINCAATIGTKTITDPDMIQEFDQILALNLRSVVSLTCAVAPELIKSKGSMINISSVTSSLPSISLGYSVSKAALCHFTRCMASDLANHGVRVNLITPSLVKTNIFCNAGVNEYDIEHIWNKAPSFSLLNRMVKAEEVAEVAAFLASDKAIGITGADYKIDCGMSLKRTPDILIA